MFEEGEADFSYQIVGCSQVNAFQQRGSISMVMRFIPFGVPKPEV